MQTKFIINKFVNFLKIGIPYSRIIKKFLISEFEALTVADD